MGSTTIPAPNTSLTRRVTTLTSGTSWTVPAGVTFVNVTLVGGGGAGGPSNSSSVNGAQAGLGMGGSVVSSTLTTTPGASITYAIGAGGSAANGGDTTFTGATTAAGGKRGGRTGNGDKGPDYFGGGNGGQPAGSDGASTLTGGQGGSGSINVEYWV